MKAFKQENAAHLTQLQGWLKQNRFHKGESKDQIRQIPKSVKRLLEMSELKSLIK